MMWVNYKSVRLKCNMEKWLQWYWQVVERYNGFSLTGMEVAALLLFDAWLLHSSDLRPPGVNSRRPLSSGGVQTPPMLGVFPCEGTHDYYLHESPGLEFRWTANRIEILLRACIIYHLHKFRTYPCKCVLWWNGWSLGEPKILYIPMSKLSSAYALT